MWKDLGSSLSAPENVILTCWKSFMEKKKSFGGSGLESANPWECNSEMQQKLHKEIIQPFGGGLE